MIRHTVDPPNTETPLEDLGNLPVAAERFYVRCNFPVPDGDAATWRLEVGGAVERPRTWTLAELATLPGVERTVTLECAGNGRTAMTPVPTGTPWGFGAVGAARFRGVRLADVLVESLPSAHAVEVVASGADRGIVPDAGDHDGEIAYEFNLDIKSATADGPMLVWAMGGEPLTPAHGFPLRLVVPGHYGMRSVKWLTSLRVTTAPFGGHFPSKYRYRGERGVPDGTPVGPMRVRSLFTWPADGALLPSAPMTLRGIAWSGDAGVSRVDVGVDGSWMPAVLARPSDESAPVTWTTQWSPTRPGATRLEVRATDAAGRSQPTEPPWNEGGYGNNVIHRLTVEIVEAAGDPATDGG